MEEPELVSQVAIDSGALRRWQKGAAGSDQAEMEAARSDGEGSVAVSAKLGQFSTDDDEVQSQSIGSGVSLRRSW